MKSAFIITMLTFPYFAFGQEESKQTPSALFKIVPQTFVNNTLKIGVEFFNKSRSKSISLLLYGRFDSYNPSQTYYYYDVNRYKGLGGELQYRKYISPLQGYATRRNKNYLQGIYVGAYMQGASYSNEATYIYSGVINGQPATSPVTISESIGNWGTGFTIGVHRTLWNVLFIDAYFGGGIQWSDTIHMITPSQGVVYSNDYSTITAPNYQGIMPKFGIQLGIPI